MNKVKGKARNLSLRLTYGKKAEKSRYYGVFLGVLRAERRQQKRGIPNLG